MGQLVTVNHNILCAVDVETTGLVPGVNEIIELCVLPLNAALKPELSVETFNVKIRPEKLEEISPSALKVNGMKLDDLKFAMAKDDALALFENWFDNEIKGKGYRQIEPLAQNWPFDLGFLLEFFGSYVDSTEDHQRYMDLFFFRGFRDTFSTAKYINDLAEYNGLRIPFPKQNLRYLCAQLNIEHIGAHTALGDCHATAEVYKKMSSIYIKGGFKIVE